MVLALGAFGCSDDSGGGGGDGGTAGTPSGGDGCTALCNSPCTGVVPGTPSGDIASCVDECEQVAIFEDCDSEIVDLLSCVEAQDCDENAVCTSEAIAFGQCFGVDF